MIFQCWKLGKKIKAFHFIHIYYCQYFIHASSSCLRICVVEPHCKTSNKEDRHSDPLLVSTVVIVFNSVYCVFSKPGLAHSVLLVCGMLCWITMGFYCIQTHLLFPSRQICRCNLGSQIPLSLLHFHGAFFFHKYDHDHFLSSVNYLC